MSTENERVVRLKLRNYARIWNVYGGFGWLLQPNYETTPGFETYKVKMEGWSGQTTKLHQDLEHIYSN